MYRNLILYSISIIVLLLAVRPVFSPFIAGTADGFAHKYRLVNFHASLSERIVRPRWVGKAVLGYGAPLFIFNYSVPYYLVDAFYKTGFSLQTSTQLYAAFTLIAAFLAMYVFASHLWGRWAGIVAATVYTFAPYHLHTTYSYEAWGEMLAFVYPPLILYCISRSWYTTTVLVWALFILSHNISSFITTPILVLLSLALSKRPIESFYRLGKVLFFVILLTAFFTLPAITQSQTIHMTTLFAKEIAMRKTYMSQLSQQIQISYGALLGTPIVYQAFTVGIPILITICFAVLNIRKKFPLFGIILIFLCLLSLFFTTPLSDIFYVFQPLQYVLYPYRFLFITTFTGSILAGYLFRKSFVAGLCIIVLSLAFGYPFTHPKLDIFSFPESFFSQPQLFRYALPTLKNMGIEEFVPKTASREFLFSEEKLYLEQQSPPQKFIIPDNTGKILQQTIHQEWLSATIDALDTTKLTVSTLFYPGWYATIDSKKTSISHDDVGRITMVIPKGPHKIKLYFGYSTIEQIGLLISACGFILFIVSLVRSKK